MKRVIVLASMALGAFITQANAQDVEAGKKVFNRCKACHDIEQPKNKVGPHLDGVVGRKAAAVADFSYSDAMKKAGGDGLIWTEDKIAEYMQNPKGMIPGNKMAFAGLKKPEEVANLIVYLKSFPAK